MIKDERMRAVYETVRCGVTVCDVGTDHAFIPIELILSGKSDKCIITDISAPSLEKGIKNARNAACGNKIKAYCTNGTLDVPLDAQTDFIIAGMGGELIVQILEQDSRLKDENHRFVLQPMSKAEELRSYLAQNGFEVINEIKVESVGRIYPIINCKYTAKPYTLDYAELLLGFKKAQTELEKRYAKRMAEQLTVKLNGVQKSENHDKEQVKKLKEQIIAVNNAKKL